MYNHFHHNNYVILSPLSHIWYMIIYIENINIFDLTTYIKLYLCSSKVSSWNSWMMNDIYRKVIVDIVQVMIKHEKYQLAIKWSVHKSFKTPMSGRCVDDRLTVDGQALHLKLYFLNFTYQESKRVEDQLTVEVRRYIFNCIFKTSHVERVDRCKTD